MFSKDTFAQLSSWVLVIMGVFETPESLLFPPMAARGPRFTPPKIRTRPERRARRSRKNRAARARKKAAKKVANQKQNEEGNAKFLSLPDQSREEILARRKAAKEARKTNRREAARQENLDRLGAVKEARTRQKAMVPGVLEPQEPRLRAVWLEEPRLRAERVKARREALLKKQEEIKAQDQTILSLGSNPWESFILLSGITFGAIELRQWSKKVERRALRNLRNVSEVRARAALEIWVSLGPDSFAEWAKQGRRF